MTLKKIKTQCRKVKLATITSEYFFEACPDIACIADLNGNVIKVNKQFETILGYSADDVEGGFFGDFVHRDDVDKTLSMAKKLIAGQTVNDFTNRYVCKNGECCYLEWNCKPWGKYVYCTARDVTAYHRKEDIYRRLIEGMDLGVVRFELVYDESGRPVDHRFLGSNSQWAKMMNVDFNELIGKTASESPVLPGPGFLAEYADVAINGTIIEREEYFPSVDKYLRYRIYSPIFNQFAIIAEDTTKKKLAAKELADARTNLDLAIEGTNVLFWDWDLSTNRAKFSDKLKEVFGYEAEYLENVDWGDFVHEEDRGRVAQAVEDYKAGLTNRYNVAFRYKHGGNGSWLWVSAGGKFVKDEAGNPIRIIGTATDISHVRQIEEELHKSEEKFKTIFDNLPTALFIFDATAYLIAANEAALKLYGANTCAELNEALWQQEGFGLDNARALANKVFKEGPQQADWMRKDAKGNVGYTSLYAASLYLEGEQVFLVAAFDVTARKRVEKEREEYRLLLKEINRRQSVMLRIASKFAKANTDNLTDSVYEAMGLIGRVINVDGIYICKYDFERNMVITVNEWHADGFDPNKEFLKEIPLGYTGEWIAEHKSGKAICIADVEAMPKQSLTRQILMLQRSKSNLRVPLLREDKLIGFISAHTVNAKKEYTENEVDIMMEFGVELVNTMVKTELDGRVKENEERFRGLLSDISSVAVTGYNEEGRLIYCNTAAKKLYGYADDADIGKKIFDYRLSESKEGNGKLDFAGVLDERDDKKVYELVRYNSKGEGIPVLSNSIVLKLSNGSREVYVVDIDLSHQKELEKTLLVEKEMLQKTIMSIGDGMILTDVYGQIKMMNGVAERLCGVLQNDAQGHMLDEIFYVIDEEAGRPIENPVLVSILKNETITMERCILVAKNAVDYLIDLTASPIRNHDEEITGVIIVFKDRTEGQAKQREVDFLSYNDYLTGMYNRRYVDKVIEDMDKAENYPLTLVYLDINGLKLINDAFGHSAGDEVLKTVSQILKSEMRKQDAIGRTGGDEFVMALPRTDEVYTEKLLAKINKICENMKLDSAIVSLASDFATRTSNDLPIEATKREAENAMYSDKMKRGKNVRMATIETVLRNINTKFDYEQMHTERVAQLSELVAMRMKLDEKATEDLKVAANLHDIGKIAVDPAVLRKPGKLDASEQRAMEQHSEIGYQILKSVDEYVHIANFVLHHHERWDGTGYPHGLAGEDIPLFSRIICVVDAFEAMTSQRNYQVRRNANEAIAELERCAGSQFDPRVVEAFVAAFRRCELIN